MTTTSHTATTITEYFRNDIDRLMYAVKHLHANGHSGSYFVRYDKFADVPGWTLKYIKQT